MNKEKWILLTIILIGFFLRVYNFHDFLRFNADQSRDAGVISNAIEERSPLPLLGPKAGGTDFRLGPVFYEFQYMAAMIFGNEPDKMAYPDLFFSVLAIPLLFFFLKKIFSDKLSLGLTAIFAFSFFAIKYSHFAWNPNSTPFWTMLFLYAFSEALKTEEKQKKLWWPILAGIALGVSVQLHTFLLIGFPIIFLVSVVCFSFANKSLKIWKNALIILIFALLVNIPQIWGEFKTKGENTQAFFSAITTKDKNNENKNLLQNIQKNVICFAGADTYILSSLGSSEDCKLYGSKDSMAAKILFSLFGIIFSAGGFVLALYYLKKEDESIDKQFLKIVLAYLIISFLIFIPLINEISVRYFLVLIFVPFLFLGFWFKFITEKLGGKYGNFFAIATISFFVAVNFLTTVKTFKEWSNYTKETENNDFENTTLKEVEMMADFIKENSEGKREVFLDGNGLYLFKFEKSIQYFTLKSGIKISQKDKIESGDILFHLINTEKTEKTLQNKKDGFNPISSKAFGRFTMVKWMKI
jgi:4-amino-4-deoxy-L-arabinose transferase-like glycosyltransferase